MSNQPPQPPSPSGSLDAARGVLRDALGGLGNLVQLVQSIRVGPKALAAVLPDVHASCAPLRGAVRDLLCAVGNALPDARPADALREFFEPRIQELERALLRAMRGPINASSRLELERGVKRLYPELDAARELVDLLEDAVRGRSVRVSLIELLRQASIGERVRPDEAIKITVSVALSTPELAANPRVAIGLFTIAANLVSGAGPARSSVKIHAEKRDTGECAVSFEPGSGDGEQRAIIARVPIAPALACAEVAARACSARIERATDGGKLSIVWSADLSIRPNGLER